MIEGGMDHRIGGAYRRQQRFGIVQRAGLHLSAGGLQGSGAGVRAREADDLMSGGLQFFENTRADKTGRAGEKNSHDLPPE